MAKMYGDNGGFYEDTKIRKQYSHKAASYIIKSNIYWKLEQ